MVRSQGVSARGVAAGARPIHLLLPLRHHPCPPNLEGVVREEGVYEGEGEKVILQPGDTWCC